jgi:hypothetical protein
MVSDEVTNLLERYKELSQINAHTDYGDSCSVERANTAVDEMVGICRGISEVGAQGLAAFATLLDEPSGETRLWAAHHILEHTAYSVSLEHRALKVIRSYSERDNLTAYGEKLWLKDWEAKRNPTFAESSFGDDIA